MGQPVDELLAALPEVGLRLHNLFQLSDGWQANVRASDGDPCFEFGRGPTAADALIAAIKAAGVQVDDSAPCCANESRNLNGGCDNCGAPCV